ncbi:MAG: DUF4350 domain-containing protein [Labilithrix sp.]|nr:DUF4350 domain-containing protein [Labilithrix sp.]MBX3222750.1 DUF4350 domain-containing protein [Labilithrix sp.]
MQRRRAGSAAARRALGRVAFVFFALVLFVPRVVSATPFDLTGSDWEGGTELVRLARAELGAARVVATTQIDFAELTPEDGLLVLYPERSLDVEELTKFMRAGGRVILLDDFGRGESLLTAFRMKRLPSPRRPAESLRHNPQLALAEPASAHPVVADVSRVVTNHPTGLGHPDLSPVLKIRASAGEPDVTVAVAGAVGQGRLLAVGDPSIVMNSMLRYSGNKTFARGLVRYAVDGDAWGKRGGRLFIAAGAFEQTGSYGGDRHAVSEWLRDLEDLFDQTRKEGLPSILAWGASIALGLALVVWVGSRAGRLHKPIVPRFVRRVPAVAQGGVAGHAAVIGAPQTTRVLAVLELKSALEEQLTTLLGLSKVPGHQDLLAQIGARGLLDAEGVHTLRRLLLRMSNVETMVVFQRSGGMVQSVRDNEVVSIARTVKQLLDAAEAGAAGGRPRAVGSAVPSPESAEPR